MKTAQETATTDLMNQLIVEIQELKSILKEKQELSINPDWIPWKRVMQFFDYGDTQMSSLESLYGLTVAKVGRRKFVHRKSIEDLLVRSSNLSEKA